MNQEQETLNKLLPFQVGHTLQLIECKIKNRVLDASDTGTGYKLLKITLISKNKFIYFFR